MIVAEIMRIVLLKSIVAFPAVPLLVLSFDPEEKHRTRYRTQTQETQTDTVPSPIPRRLALYENVGRHNASHCYLKISRASSCVSSF